MVLKTLLFILLITGTLGGDNDQQFKDKSEESKEKKFYSKEKYYKDKENFHGEKYKNSEFDAGVQLEKDYGRWSDKEYIKRGSEEKKENNHFYTVNEIDDNLYVDKFNKNGYAFNKKIKKDKTPYHEKQEATKREEVQELQEDQEKPISLLHDTKINYIYNNKKVSSDSEMISESKVGAYKKSEGPFENYPANGNDFYSRKNKKIYKNLKSINLEVPPPANETVKMARYIVHAVDWAALGTLSGRPPTKGNPFVCVKATSDGSEVGSSGVPFFYMSPNDLCTQDLQKDNRVSIVMTLSETKYCKNKNIDPQDPRCAKVTLSGKIKKIKPGTKEEKFARKALFYKHPQMENWPTDHNWFFTKLKIGQIILLDKYGGALYVKVQDYLNG